MKEKYVKPLLAVEMFSMVQSVARDCADNIPKENLTFSDLPKCEWNLGGGFILFVVGVSECNMDGESSGIVCYNNPDPDKLIFRS